MSENEEYVRANWEYIEVQHLPHNVQTDRYCDWRIVIWSRFLPSNPASRFILAYGTKAEAWVAAAEFTRERLEQIRQVEVEIMEIAEWCDFYHKYVMKAMIAAQDTPTLNRNNAAMLAAYSRILASRKSALADLSNEVKFANNLIEQMIEMYDHRGPSTTKFEAMLEIAILAANTNRTAR